MSALDRLVKEESFRNFDEVLEFVDRLSKEHYMPLRISDISSFITLSLCVLTLANIDLGQQENE
ncbi:hypothetical protein DAPPUDRAFT_328806 [Daphnia pulex]|uniref:Uncharacterized protein n=1 Tax=Daphnia pulex TaxID=6669 RepID=E9HET9_DAPPU|nr:hypothetical protein DAPPUDRAFT_328806 [Daphnia pulex]|eukprot:EFX69754.1 hypothetical protein DAPPUDRAFT_328806 [Daphnia pulex]